MDEILDKFAVRIILLVGFTFCVALAGCYLLLWINSVWDGLTVTFVLLFFWSLHRAMKRDLRLPWERTK